MDSPIEKFPIGLEHFNKDATEFIVIDWCFGNTCNYACSYCPKNLHDGSIKWESEKQIIIFCEKIIDHYKKQCKRVYFQFSGGEPTLHPGFISLIKFLHNKECIVGLISNGSRTLRWWNYAKPYIDKLILTHHIEYVDIDHFIEVATLMACSSNTHINITMLPEFFSKCLINANRIITECPSASVTLKPLLIDFSENLYYYTEDQKIIMRNSNSVSEKNNQIEVRGLMRYLYNDGTTTKVKASELILNNENRWFGWTCSIGVELLYINYKGEIYRGTCKQGGLVGKISDESINFPETSIICRRKVCSCVTDILTSRHI